jgi:hypothetical protein
LTNGWLESQILEEHRVRHTWRSSTSEFEQDALDAIELGHRVCFFLNGPWWIE